MSKPRLLSIKKFQHPVYNLRFGLLCLSSVFFSASYNLLIPELPAYLSSLGGAEYIGLIISLFTLTAGLSRPFSGRLIDTIGRKPVMIVGPVVCIICGGLYPVLGTIGGFLFLRLLHGFSTGFNPTATSTYVSDVVPQKYWGEAMGIQGLCFGTGLALGPALGGYLSQYFSLDVLFYLSSVMALISVILILNLGETLERKQAFSWKLLRLKRSDILAKEAFPPALVTFFAYLGFGMMLTLIPDWSSHLGFQNKGSFFIVFTVSSLVIRIFAGKVSDKYGREPLVIMGLILLIIAFFEMGMLQTKMGLMISATLYGLAMGILSPSLNAWTVDLSVKNEKGKAISTMYIALEAGIGLGALFSGMYYAGSIENIPVVMISCSAISILALIYMLFKSRLGIFVK